MTRLRYNGLRATLAGPLTSSSPSITFLAALTHSGGVPVPTIGAGDYIPLCLLSANGNLAEIVHLTAYAEDATTGTISRGEEGTSGVAHSTGRLAVAAPTVEDIEVGQLIFLGAWDADTNTPELEDGIGVTGNFYEVSVAGTVDLGSGSIAFDVGDFVSYDGAVWTRTANPAPGNPVLSDEPAMRVVRGIINTSGPAIVEGSGFSLTGGGTGQVLVTFDTPFSDVPAVVMTAKDGGATLGPTAGHHSGFAQTAAAFKIAHVTIGTGYTDGIVHFIAIGPA